MASESDFTCEKAIEIAQKIVRNATGKDLRDVEIDVFKGCWEGRSYERIAKEINRTTETVTREIAYKLWQKLSQGLPKKINKYNLREVLTSEWKDHTSPERKGEEAKIPLEFPDGFVAIDSNFYVQRQPQEKNCYNKICEPGSLIRIKAPKQMGKTSLLMRILHKAEEQGDRTVYLNLEQIDKESYSSLDTFLRRFCAGIGRKLKLDNKLNDYWEDDISSNMRCETYFEEYLIPAESKPLTLGLDNVDRLFQYPEIYDDFFSLLRFFHEEGKLKRIWQNFRLVLLHSTEMYLQLDINRSPFNAGFPVELPEFDRTQVLSLAHRHQLNWNDEQVQAMMSTIGGHPFLVRLALYKIANQEITLDCFLRSASSESGIYQNHLHRIAETLTEQPELVEAIRKVVTSNSPVQVERDARFKLQALGLVNIQNDEVVPRCELYRQFFQNY